MFRAIVGQSEDPLAVEAIREVVGQIRSALLPELQPQAGIVFCSIDLDHTTVLSGLRAEFPTMEVIGCTTDGELGSQCGFVNDSLTLMAFVSDTVEIHAGIGKNAAANGEKAGKEAATSAFTRLERQKGQAKFAIIFTELFTTGAPDIDIGIQGVLGQGFPVFGGAAAAHAKRRKTFQFYQGEVVTDSVVMLLFAGAIEYGFGIKEDYAPIGAKEPVTLAQGNVLYRIGGQRAFDYCRRYVGEYDLFMDYGLVVFSEDSDRYHICGVPAADSRNGSVTLTAKVKEGAMVQIGMMDKNALIDSCRTSLRMAQETFAGSKIAAALLFSCATRKMSLGLQVHKEAREVQNQLPGIPFAGFYSYGEYGPLQRGDAYLLHSTTFVTVLIGEGEPK